MPRTGGVYSPPAGTKGVPNTTIQSVPYNAFIDDLTADANAARPVTAGGTGATTASGARTALGLEIGTNVQAYDALLQSIAGLTTSANQMIYLTAANTVAVTAVTDYGRSLIDDVDAAAARATLALGTASTRNVGTSGGNVPVLDGNNTHSGINTFTGPFKLTGFAPTIEMVETESGAKWFQVLDGSGFSLRYGDLGTILLDLHPDGNITWFGNKIWHAGNDGVGSGLDADLLDGQSSAYYTDIAARLGFTPVQQGGGANQVDNKVYIGWGTGSALRAQVDVTDLGKIWTDSLAGGAPASGWVKFPNGLILQSGSSVVSTNVSADGSVTFPTSFPSACFSVTACIGDATLSATDLKVYTSPTTTGFSFRSPGAPSTSVRVNWFAWGY